MPAVRLVSLFVCLSAFQMLAVELPSAESFSGSTTTAESDNTAPPRKIKLPDVPTDFSGLRNSGPDTGAPVPRPPRPAVRQPQRSVLDSPGNWGFATAEDVIQEYMTKVNGKVPALMPDGRDWNSLSPVERYYERQMRGQTATNAAPPMELPSFSGMPGLNGPSALDAFHGERAGNEPVSRLEGLPDLLGLRNNPFSPDAIRQRDSQQRQMEAFRKALDLAKPHYAPVNTDTAVSADRNNPWNTWQAPAYGTPANMAPTAYPPISGVYQNPAVPTAIPSAPTAPTAPVSPDQYTSTAPAPSPTRVAPPRADFSFPQRAF